MADKVGRVGCGKRRRAPERRRSRRPPPSRG